LESEDPKKIRDIQASGTSQYLMNETVLDTVTGNRFAKAMQSEFFEMRLRTELARYFFSVFLEKQ
jgi:hypothetical protein